MDSASVGLVGAIAGTVIGLLGAVIGTYAGISQARSREERRFIYRWVAAAGAAIVVMLLLLGTLPAPYNALLWVPYGVGLALGIRYASRRLKQLQAEAPPHGQFSD